MDEVWVTTIHVVVQNGIPVPHIPVKTENGNQILSIEMTPLIAFGVCNAPEVHPECTILDTKQVLA